MKTIRSLSMCLSTTPIGFIAISPVNAAEPKTKAQQKNQLLFVQNAESATFAGGKLILHNVNPLTICFSDRPKRLAGHMPTADWVPMWGEGKDSFLKDPPNGNLSMLHGRDVISAVVILKNPQYADGNLSYECQHSRGNDSRHDRSVLPFHRHHWLPTYTLLFCGRGASDSMARRILGRRLLWPTPIQ